MNNLRIGAAVFGILFSIISDRIAYADSSSVLAAEAINIPTEFNWTKYYSKKSTGQKYLYDASTIKQSDEKIFFVWTSIHDSDGAENAYRGVDCLNRKEAVFVVHVWAGLKTGWSVPPSWVITDGTNELLKIICK